MPTSGLLTLACTCVHTQTWTYTNTHTHGEKLCHSETITALTDQASGRESVVLQNFVLSFTPHGGSQRGQHCFHVTGVKI